MGHKATEAQKKIFDFVEHGTGNGIIDAVAGAGKTTTLMGCVTHIPNLDDVIYCAFNTSIRKELQKKFHAAKKNVKVCTIHSLGFQMLRATGDFKIDDGKYSDIIKNTEFFESLTPEIDEILNYHDHCSVAQIKSLEERRDTLDWDEKNTLNESQQYVYTIIKRILDINQKYRCTLTNPVIDEYDGLVRHFGIFPSWELDSETFPQELECYFRAHQKLLKEGTSIAISHGIIDFTDQLYLPFVRNLTSRKKYGFVFVDECQDLSKAQLYVVKQYLRADGRLLAVGDPYQAIYGFAGADCESFNRVKETFNCTVLGLTDCFRCPQSVIEIAQSIRPDIKGFKDYPGKIYIIPQREVVHNIRGGDLVICRSRQPLMAMALKLITKDFKVKIHPDELQEFMGNYKSNFKPQELRGILSEESIDKFFDQVRERNEKRIIRENQNADPIIRQMIINEEVKDMEETLIFLKKKYFDWRLNTLDSILMRLKHTLSSPDDDAIKISSIHRAKGLENDRVFILEYNKLPFKRDLEWERTQERNLHYVAVTRPKEELYLCDDQLVTDGDEDATENIEPAKPVNAQEVASFFKRDEKEDDEGLPFEPDSIEDQVVTEQIKDALATQISANIDNTKDVVSLPPLGARSAASIMISLKPIQKVNRIPAKYYSLAPQEDTPFPALNANNLQKAKYWSITANMQDTEYSVVNVISSQYLDAYCINTPDGIEIYDGRYNSSGQFTFHPRGNCKNSASILPYLNDESNYNISFEYQPQNHGFEAVHEIIQAKCQELGICNTNIFEESYACVYCFRSSDAYSYIKLFYNGKKIITSVSPSSTLGDDDLQLKLILETLQNLWQR